MSAGSDEFEVVVVGAGIAGSACAKFLAEGGVRVAVVDARSSDNAGARWVNGVPRDVYAEIGVAPPTAPERRSDSAPFFVTSPSGAARVRIDDSPIDEIDMRLLGARLRKSAVDAGAIVLDETRVEGVTLDGQRPIALITSSRRGRRSLRATVFVDASGLHAVVRRAAFRAWPAVDPRDLCVAAQEVRRIADVDGARRYLARNRFAEHETLAMTGTDGGFSVLNVRVDFGASEVSILTGSIPAETNARGEANPTGVQMIARLCDEERWIGERIFGGAAAIPLRRPYTRQSAPGLALLGDAGAQVFSAHGSGIAIGLRAAKLLAQTIIAAPRSRLGDGDVLHRYAAGFHRDHGAILDGYDVVRRLSQSLEKRESEALIAAGLITPSSARAALAQALPPLSPRELPAIVRGFARAPRLAAKLGLALARLPLLAAHASAYPDAPDVHALAAFESRRAHLLGVPRDPVV